MILAPATFTRTTQLSLRNHHPSSRRWFGLLTATCLALALAACGGDDKPAQQAPAQPSPAADDNAGGQPAAAAKQPAADGKSAGDGFEMLYTDWAAAEAAWLQEAAPVIDREVQGRNSMAEDALIVFTVLHAKPGGDDAVVAEVEKRAKAHYRGFNSIAFHSRVLGWLGVTAAAQGNMDLARAAIERQKALAASGFEQEELELAQAYLAECYLYLRGMGQEDFARDAYGRDYLAQLAEHEGPAVAQVLHMLRPVVYQLQYDAMEHLLARDPHGAVYFTEYGGLGYGHGLKWGPAILFDVMRRGGELERAARLGAELGDTDQVQERLKSRFPPNRPPSTLPPNLPDFAVDAAYLGNYDLARQFSERYYAYGNRPFYLRNIPLEDYLALVDLLQHAESISDPEGARELYARFQEVEAVHKNTGDKLYKAIQAETGAALARAGFADRGMTVARATSTPFEANVVEALLKTDGLEAAQRFGQNGFVYPNYQFAVLSVADAYAAAGHTDTAVNALLDIRQGPYKDIVPRIRQLAGKRFDTAVARSLAPRKDWERKVKYELQAAQRAGTPMTREEYLAENPGPSFFGMQKAQPTEWFHAVARAGAHPAAVETAIRYYRDNIELRLAALAGHHGVPLAW